MNLCDFLHFNSECPVCGNQLTLYMQWVQGLCFRAEPTLSTYTFFPLKFLVETGEDSESEDWVNAAAFSIEDHGKTCQLAFGDDYWERRARRYRVYFFFLCNPDAFRSKGKRDYELDLYTGCYYRSSPFLEFTKVNGATVLRNSISDQGNLVNNDEAFAFKAKKDDHEKAYMLGLDYADKETKLWHYTITEEQRQDPTFRPNTFENTMPLLSVRPNFALAERDKLLSRLDSWIVLS